MSIRLKLIIGTAVALVISAAVIISTNIWQMQGLLDRYMLNSSLPAVSGQCRIQRQGRQE